MNITEQKLSQIREILIMPYSHADFAWTNTRQWHIWRYLQGFCEMLDLMKVNSAFTWIIDNVVHCLIPFIKYCPERVEELKKRIREGRVYVANGGYSLPRPDYIGEESYIRNLVQGKLFLQNFLGQENIDFFYNADTAGGHSQLPQIFQLSGHKYYSFMRSESALNHKNIPKQYIWKGLDGSSVIVSRGSYGGFLFTEYLNDDIAEKWSEVKEEFLKEELKERLNLISTDTVCLYYGGDDFRPLHNLLDKPISLLEFMKEWNKRENSAMRFSTPKEYFQRLENAQLPVQEGVVEQCELSFNAPIRGDESMWRLRKELDKLIVKAECLCSMASSQGMDYPEYRIESLWKNLFEITGHAIEWVLTDDFNYLKNIAYGAVCDAKNLIHEACDYISQHLGTEELGQYIVFNPSGHSRTEIVKLHVTGPRGVRPFILVDENGNNLEYQIMEIYTGDKIYKDTECNSVDVVTLVDLPPMGYRVVKTVECTKGQTIDIDNSDISAYGNNTSKEDMAVGGNINNKTIINNDSLEITIENGVICSLKDNKTSPSSFVSTNAVQTLRYVETHESDQWVSNWETKTEHYFEPKEWQITKNGPLIWQYRVTGTLGAHKVVQHITLNKGERAVNFETIIDSVGGEGYFIVDFPCKPDTKLYVDIPFGVEERVLAEEIVNSETTGVDEANIAELSWKGQFYGKSWTAFESGGLPVAIVSENCSIYYNHDIERNYVSLLLNRLMPLGKKSDDRQQRWIKQTHSSIEGKGKHTFKYSLYLPEKWGEFNDIIRFSNSKYLAIEVTPKFNIWSAKSGAKAASVIDCSTKNVIVTTFYKEKDAYILRLFETEGRETELNVRTGFTFTSVELIDLMGQTLKEKSVDIMYDGNAIKLQVKPWQIVTLRFI